MMTSKTGQDIPAEANTGKEESCMPEKSLTECLDEMFKLPQRDYTQYSPLTLAYIGDAVYDLIVRTMLVKRANMQTAKLHRDASSIVNAGAQADLLEKLLPLLTEEEAGVCRRAQNAKPGHAAKNASREDYMEATALEALVGYLYLQGRYERLTQLIYTGLLEPGEG